MVYFTTLFTSILYRCFYITVTFTLPLFVGGIFHHSVYLYSLPLLLHYRYFYITFVCRWYISPLCLPLLFILTFTLPLFVGCIFHRSFPICGPRNFADPCGHSGWTQRGCIVLHREDKVGEAGGCPGVEGSCCTDLLLVIRLVGRSYSPSKLQQIPHRLCQVSTSESNSKPFMRWQFLYKPWEIKRIFLILNLINVLVSFFWFIWIPML